MFHDIFSIYVTMTNTIILLTALFGQSVIFATFLQENFTNMSNTLN